MTVKDILIWPHPVLDTPARAVVEITQEIQDLVDDLIDTCEEVGGVGLAAPQIGVSYSVFVVNIGSTTGTSEGYETFINPVEITSNGLTKLDEGCLSLPGIRGKVERFEQYGIEYTSLEGKREHITSDGVLAQALQHEMDHIQGNVMVKKLPRFKRGQVRQKMKILKRRMKNADVTYHEVIRTPEA